MKQKRNWRGKGVRWVTAVCLLLAAAAMYGWWHFFYSREEMERSVALVECIRYETLTPTSGQQVFFAGIGPDSSLVLPALAPDSTLMRPHRKVGWWVNRYPLIPSCHGTLLTEAPSGSWHDTLSGKGWRQVRLRTIQNLEAEHRRMKKQLTEMEEYLRVHGVQDEGYTDIAERALLQRGTVARTAALLLQLRRFSPDVPPVHRVHYIYKVMTAGGNFVMKPRATDTQQGWVLLQTADEQTPPGVQPLSPLPWAVATKGEKLVASYPGLLFLPSHPLANSAKKAPVQAVIIPVYFRPDSICPSGEVLFPGGSPVFTPTGGFVGWISDGRFISHPVLSDKL